MGRSSARKTEMIRADIVSSAARLFCASGVDDVGVAEVMNAAGLTHGGFYAHFSSKEHLAAEACAFAFQRVAGRRRRTIDELLEEMTTRSCPIVCFAGAASRKEHDGQFRDAYARGVELVFDAFVRLAEERSDELRCFELRMIFDSMVGAAVLALALNSPERLASARMNALAALRGPADHTHV